MNESNFIPNKINPELDEGKIEKQFNANLLTNYETTIEFIKAIEGQGWLENQPPGITAKYTLAYVMNWLNESVEDNGVERLTTLYGNAGGNRYVVFKNGDIKFKASFSNARSLDIAKGLSFPIDRIH